MGKNSAIEWCDHSFTPWVGCEKISPGCDNCYAEAMDSRFRGGHWGPHAIRRVTVDSNWKGPLKWNRMAEAEGVRARVFCSPLSDIGDRKVPELVRERLWSLIGDTPWLEWLLLTKRIGNMPKILPSDWLRGYANAGLMATVVNQMEADRDIPKLLDIPSLWRGLSIEPMLGSIDLRPFLPGLDWVIVGGESGHGSRPVLPDWVRSMRDQCLEFNVAFFFKQWGEWGPADSFVSPSKSGVFPQGDVSAFKNMREVAKQDIDFWKNRDDYNSDVWMFRYGKKSAGCALDGIEYKAFPDAHRQTSDKMPKQKLMVGTVQ